MFLLQFDTPEATFSQSLRMDQPTTRLLELLQAAKHHKVHRSLQLQELWQFIEQLKGFEVA